VFTVSTHSLSKYVTELSALLHTASVHHEHSTGHLERNNPQGIELHLLEQQRVGDLHLGSIHKARPRHQNNGYSYYGVS